MSENSTDIISDLSSSQKEAVIYNDGPSLIIAGAGSGKTRVLTCKIAYLLNMGLPPQNIIALTFTNKAAREMKERIANMVGYKIANRLSMGTFHSVFSRILRQEAPSLNFKSDFVIYDTGDSKNTIKAIVKEMGLDEKVYKPSIVLSRISFAKNSLISAPAYYSSKLVDNDFFAKIPMVKDIYSAYVAKLKQSSALDFDDLLYYTNVLFRDFPEIKEKYQSIFQYILVDEYQDVNFSQHLLVKFLAEKHHRVCVVGDDAQSIYSFRGADIENILTFQQTYPEARVFKLERNYRSTQNIVGAANSLIAKNKNRIKKSVFSEKEFGSKVSVLSAYSDIEEGFIIANQIIRLKERNQYKWSDFAVLYRTNAQSRLIEDAFRKNNIPYRIYGGVSFYQRKEVKDVLAYIRLSINTDDEEAFKRIINFPARGIGDTTLSKVFVTAKEFGSSLFDVASNPLNFNLSVNAGTASKLTGFANMIQTFVNQVHEKDAYEAASFIIRNSGITTEFQQSKTAENISSLENIEELLSSIYQYCEAKREEGIETSTMIDFLSEVSLLTDQDVDKNAEDERVTLMTIHLAKGLEFKNILIAGVEEELLPSIYSTENEKNLEEERRLFYVAITRAEENCFVSYSKTRFRNGQMKYTKSSRFIDDIDLEYVNLPNDFDGKASSSFDFSQQKPSFFKEKSEINTSQVLPSYPKKLVKLEKANTNLINNQVNLQVSVGNKIQHERFGIGEVIALAEADGDMRITVKFENAGERVLLLKFAKFTIVE